MPASLIRHDLFRAIRLQIAVARAAVMDQDSTARALLLLIREGQLEAAADDPAFNTLLDRVAPRMVISISRSSCTTAISGRQTPSRSGATC